MFKELFTESNTAYKDGGNAGEYNQARQEQAEQAEKRKKFDEKQAEFLVIAKEVIPLLARATKKSWGYEQSAFYATRGLDTHAVMTNPGRLKFYKIRKGNYPDYDVLTELFTAIANTLGKDYSVEGHYLIVKKGNKTYEISNWGPKVNLKISTKY